MTPEEKRDLKFRGKQIVEQRSATINEALKKANPAPVGSDEWVKNYRTVRDNEKWLSQQQPERILADEVAHRFVLLSAQETGRVEPWVECLECHDVLHSYPLHSTQCSCGTVTITYGRPPRVKAKGDKARSVGLIAKGGV
jgi:hypothetical protein